MKTVSSAMEKHQARPLIQDPERLLAGVKRSLTCRQRFRPYEAIQVWQDMATTSPLVFLGEDHCHVGEFSISRR
jgi:hypothetical protein